MNNNRIAVLTPLLLVAFTNVSAAKPQPSASVVWSFSGNKKGGGGPMGSLIESNNGVFYGTTSGYPSKKIQPGTVFSLTHTAKGWLEETLYNFKDGQDGSYPVAGLAGKPAKALYGTTASGGDSQGKGTIFVIKPPAPGGTTWTEKVLYRFGSDLLANPQGTLFEGPGGILYGTTKYGGSASMGGVFSLSPPTKGQKEWTETTLYNFQGGKDGEYPLAGLYMDSAGALYGTTVYGGGGFSTIFCSGTGSSPTGCGAVFKLTPPAGGQTAWTESVIYGFTGAGPDGLFPASTLVADASGNLYGTTIYGGAGIGQDLGNVFMLSPPAPGQTTWTETTLYQFTGPDGESPQAGVVFDASGNLYGTTEYGGANGTGVAFSLTPPAAGQTQWTESVLHSFAGGTDGEFPLASVMLDSNDNVFGTTWKGGSNYGTVFEITP